MAARSDTGMIVIQPIYNPRARAVQRLDNSWSSLTKIELTRRNDSPNILMVEISSASNAL